MQDDLSGGPIIVRPPCYEQNRCTGGPVLCSSSHVAGLGLTCGRRVSRWLSVLVDWLVWCPSYGKVCSRGANQPTGGAELD